jgi:hypothetical protein
MSKMVFYFEKVKRRTQEIEQRAVVYVTLDQDLGVAKFDVQLDSIPGELVDGYEVVAEFEAHDF